MIAMILKKPTLHIVKKDFSSYWVIALIGATMMLIFSNITPVYAINSMLSSGAACRGQAGILRPTTGQPPPPPRRS